MASALGPPIPGACVVGLSVGAPVSPWRPPEAQVPVPSVPRQPLPNLGRDIDVVAHPAISVAHDDSAFIPRLAAGTTLAARGS
jgi:hypothetical protein